jgi:hypothetical protein
MLWLALPFDAGDYERFNFYEEARKCFAVVQCVGERRSVTHLNPIAYCLVASAPDPYDHMNVTFAYQPTLAALWGDFAFNFCVF